MPHRTASRRTLLKASAAVTAAAVVPASAGLAEIAAQGDGTGVAGEYLLPNNRILSYYGFPTNELMGILGEYAKEDLLPILQEQAAAYEAVDPSRPVKLAYEVIASVAQRDAGADGNYLEYTSPDWIQEYVDFTAANDLLLILDMQYGYNTTEQELNAVREYLMYPHVHLALDPEFSVNEGEVPGEVLGQIDAADVNWALQELATLSAENGLPPKILVVHQFNLYSITNKEQIAAPEGVQFVLEVDGWGDPEAKRETYSVVAGEVPFDFYGFKLWYQQDVPLMTPEEVLALVPSPDIVIYQ
ncbi:MAG: twin-arginine translocation signal domain-containing protein [Thermomicrobiales bacterium]|nr:twin-arginine translocation signal domain-containing protein [Thermomicrobiales bacterium]MCO5223268.1 twin-arginine translocation signal domain-containing protein [Thermomicrobiales bacterium]